MKTSLLLLTLTLAHASFAADLWVTTDGVDAPESALADPQSSTVYLSNVAGSPGEKDGKGWISKLDLSGKVVKSKWVDGLNAPKGMRAAQGTLWVSDIDEVVGIDTQTGKVTSNIKVDGAKFLNDVDVASDGTVYVSDTVQSTIYAIKDGKASIFVTGPEFEAPNGLLIQGEHLIVAAWGIPAADFSTKVPGRLYKIDLKTKKKTLITRKPLGNLDGLEVDAKGNYLVSDWMAGIVYRVTPKGSSKKIATGFKNAADIGYISDTDTLIVPDMGASKVRALHTSSL